MRATDADTIWPFNLVTYELTELAREAGFTIDQNGVLRGSNIGSTGQSSYIVEVIARDGGMPSLTDTTTVTVNVTKNSERPVWRVAGTGEIRILETQPLSQSIATVSLSNDICH